MISVGRLWVLARSESQTHGFKSQSGFWPGSSPGMWVQVSIWGARFRYYSVFLLGEQKRKARTWPSSFNTILWGTYDPDPRDKTLSETLSYNFLVVQGHTATKRSGIWTSNCNLSGFYEQPLSLVTSKFRLLMKGIDKKRIFWNSPGSAVVKTPYFHCRGVGHGFNPWLGELRSCMPCDQKNKQNILLKIGRIHWEKFISHYAKT